MDVTIEPHVGASCANGERVDLGQYRIRVDGLTSGYVGYKPGSKILMSRRFGPVEMQEIESQVSSLLGRSHPDSVQSPDVPAELLQEQNEEDLIDDDDFNA